MIPYNKMNCFKLTFVFGKFDFDKNFFALCNFDKTINFFPR